MKDQHSMSYSYDYPRPALSVDVVIFRTERSQQEVLLIQRKNEPFADHWALPGGFLDIDETLECAAARELKEETQLDAIHLHQIGAYSEVHRDPRGRVISVAFLVEIGEGQTPVAADDAKQVRWFDVHDLPDLAFDHQQIIRDGQSKSI